MQLSPYLFFDGQCKEAFEFYEQVLGGKIEAMMTHAEMPAEEQPPAEFRDLILHAYLTVGGQALMGSDCPPGTYEKPQGFSVSISVDDPREAERIFNALAANGNVTMPLDQTFFAVRFGMLVDRFGTPWMVNCSQPA